MDSFYRKVGIKFVPISLTDFTKQILLKDYSVAEDMIQTVVRTLKNCKDCFPTVGRRNPRYFTMNDGIFDTKAMTFTKESDLLVDGQLVMPAVHWDRDFSPDEKKELLDYVLQNPPDDICTLKDFQTHIQKARLLSKCPSFLSTFKKQRFSFEGDDKISTGDMLIYIIGLAIVQNNREYKRELLGLLVGGPGTSKSTFLDVITEIFDPGLIKNGGGVGNVYPIETDTKDRHGLISGSTALLGILRETPINPDAKLENVFAKLASREAQDTRGMNVTANNKRANVLAYSILAGNHPTLGFKTTDSKLRRRFAIFKFLEKLVADTSFFTDKIMPEIPDIFLLLVSVSNYIDCFLKNSNKHAKEYFSEQLADWTEDTFLRSSPLYCFIQDDPNYVSGVQRTHSSLRSLLMDFHYNNGESRSKLYSKTLAKDSGGHSFTDSLDRSIYNFALTSAGIRGFELLGYRISGDKILGLRRLATPYQEYECAQCGALCRTSDSQHVKTFKCQCKDLDDDELIDLNFFYRQHKVNCLVDVEKILVKNKKLRDEYPRLWELSPRLLNLKKNTDDSIWQMRVAFRRMSR
eukprot:Stramenopile-MAST_4_protein_4849